MAQKIIDEIMDYIHGAVRNLSDVDFLEVIETVSGNLDDEAQAKISETN